VVAADRLCSPLNLLDALMLGLELHGGQGLWHRVYGAGLPQVLDVAGWKRPSGGPWRALAKRTCATLWTMTALIWRPWYGGLAAGTTATGVPQVAVAFMRTRWPWSPAQPAQKDREKSIAGRFWTNTI